MVNEPEINTVLELELWLKENCYSKHNYSINGNSIIEGCGLENIGGLYQWYYTERGNKSILKYFNTEKEAVQHAFEEIKANNHANRHYIGMYSSEQKVEKILGELKRRKIEFWTDKIPYGGLKDLRTRIFVIGCGIINAKDLVRNN